MKQKKNNLLVLAVLLLTLAAVSCTRYTSRIKGQGPVVKQTYELPPVSALSLSIDADVFITHGDSQTVLIEGQQNILNNIEKYVTDQGLWNIGYYHSVTSHAGVRILITTPLIEYVRISGSGNVQATNHFPDSANVYAGISGSGNIYLSTGALSIETEISGSGDVVLAGSAWDHHINISGSGHVRAFDLETRNTYVRISGSGDSEVRVEDYLNVTISGSGSVYYKGNPDIEANISGSGTIVNWN